MRQDPNLYSADINILWLEMQTLPYSNDISSDGSPHKTKVYTVRLIWFTGVWLKIPISFQIDSFCFNFTCAIFSRIFLGQMPSQYSHYTTTRPLRILISQARCICHNNKSMCPMQQWANKSKYYCNQNYVNCQPPTASIFTRSVHRRLILGSRFKIFP